MAILPDIVNMSIISIVLSVLDPFCSCRNNVKRHHTHIFAGQMGVYALLLAAKTYTPI